MFLFIKPVFLGAHRRIVLLTLVTWLAAWGASPVWAAQWAAHHGLSGSQYQQKFEHYAQRGYRLQSIAGYESGGRARYAGLWIKTSGPAWAARHGLTASQYQAAFDDYRRQGYRLTFVNGYAIRGSARYAAIWEKRAGPQWAARHGLTAAQYQQAVDDMVKRGFAPSHVSVLSLNGSPRFAALFTKGGPRWAARHGLTAAGYQAAFEDFARQGYRLKVVSGYRQGNSDRYAAIWVKTQGPQWSARHGIRSQHYQYVFDNYRYQGWVPSYIEAFNARNGVRFNGLWTNEAFSAKDLNFIRNKVQNYMQANDVEGLSIAISRNERLLYAAGFGHADKARKEPFSPRHLARIASVSKPITRVAVTRVIQDTNLALNAKVFGSNSVLGGQFATPSNNPRIEDITVDHLIRHRAGFVNKNKQGQDSDPMFAYSGSGHKGLIEWALENYPLGSDPGAQNVYSNFGYCLLGRVIEAKTKQSYEAYVRNKILRPAGARRMVIGGNKEADRKKDEVKYYGGGAYSSVKPVRFDSHGGWIATPIDLLRFLKHENVLPDRYSHSGAMAGTKSFLRRRTDGFSYAAVSNTSKGSTTKIDELLKEIVEGVGNWPNHDYF